jgi:outer membrane protein assembly factor BamB
MKTSWIPTAVPACLAALAGVALILWLSTGLWKVEPVAQADGRQTPWLRSLGNQGRPPLALREPGADGTPEPVQGGASRATQAGLPIRGPGQPAEIPGVWPAFRGPQRNAICDDGTPLARVWPPSGPPVLWRIELGQGYASPVIRDGRVYVLDYDEQLRADTMRCLSLADGREIWRNSYPVEVTPNHGCSRTIPALIQDCVVSIGPRCHVACWDAETGQNRWLIDMVQRFGAEERQWYTGQCPLVEEDRVILAPGGPEALLVAVEYLTGQVLWKTPNPRGWKMTHSSIMTTEFAGQKMYVYCGTGGTAGVAADDGRLLWDETSWVENFATSPSPLPLPDGRIFLSSGYDITGAMMLQIKQVGDKLDVEQAYTLKRKEFNSEQQTPIYYRGHIYGVRKLREQMLCLDLDGKEVWNSGNLKFGHGPYMIADGLLVALADDGLLASMEATHEGYRPLAQFQVFENGHDAWGPMAMVAGRLIVRDMHRMACVDLRAETQ